MKKTYEKYPGYEKTLFRLKIQNLIDSKYSVKEIMNFTGWSESTVRVKYKQAGVDCPQLTNR